MGFFITLGGAGFALVLIFLTKLGSLPPFIRAAVVGARIIIGICTVLIIWWIKYEYNKDGKDLLGNLKLQPENLIGQWQTEFEVENSDKPYSTVNSFYADSTFYSSSEGSTGKWSYNPENETLYMHYTDRTNEFKLASFVDGKYIRATNSESFTKINDTPETPENIEESAQLREQQEQEKINQYAGVDMAGSWGLKRLRYGGTFVEDLGAYTLNSDGTGSYYHAYSGPYTLTYKLDKEKKRFTLAKYDQVISISVDSFDGEILTGSAIGEEDAKYVLAKAL